MCFFLFVCLVSLTKLFFRHIPNTMQQLEESNQFCEDIYSRSLTEVKNLKSSRSLLKERLLAEQQTKLADFREKRDRILRVQNAELEAHKRSHQFNCQELCESVLEANNELDRLRALWESHAGGGAFRLQSQSRESDNNQVRTKPSRMLQLAFTVMVMAVLAFVFLSATAGGNERTITTTHTNVSIE
jgi:hypothetical protein